MIYISAAGQKKIAKHASICVACFAEHLIKLISRFHSSCVRFNRNTFDMIVRIYQLFLLDLAQTFRPIEHQTRPTCWEHKPQIRFINSPTFFFFFLFRYAWNEQLGWVGVTEWVALGHPPKMGGYAKQARRAGWPSWQRARRQVTTIAWAIQ